MSCRTMMIPAASVLMLILTSVSWAGHGCRGTVCCPQCQTVCQLNVDEGTEEKSCWQVECEEICVPRVVFPWQKSCCDPTVNNGACVKVVKKLKKHKYECPTCEYSWTPKKVARCGCGGAGCASCGATAYEVVDGAERPVPSEPATSQAEPPAQAAEAAVARGDETAPRTAPSPSFWKPQLKSVSLPSKAVLWNVLGGQRR